MFERVWHSSTDTRTQVIQKDLSDPAPQVVCSVMLGLGVLQAALYYSS